MAFVLTCRIAIGSHVFDQVHQVEIRSSWKTLGDSAEIQLPHFKKVNLEKDIKPGDKVTINLGYRGKYEGEEFVGYVSHIKPNTPVEILCEDNIYLMKRVNMKAAYKDITLKTLITNIVNEVKKQYPDAGISLHADIPDVKFDTFRLNNVTAASALQKLKDEYGLTSYFRGNQLFVGLSLTETLEKVNYSLAYNVISHDLEFHQAEDVRLKVKAISIKKDNTRQEVETGDDDGQQRTLYFYSIQDKAKLRLLADEELKRLKFDGYEGEFKTFLIPFATHGMTAVVLDPEHPEREGNYAIDEVKTTFGVDGARRIIKPGRKLSDSNEQS